MDTIDSNHRLICRNRNQSLWFTALRAIFGDNMNYLEHLVRSKGADKILSRALSICRRFGFTSTKISRALHEIVRISSAHGCKPTFFVTASLLDSHRQEMMGLLNKKLQVGLHGNYHIDHARLPGKTQQTEMTIGVEKLKSLGIDVAGFRGPFLRFNDATGKAVTDSGLAWSSHHSLLFHDKVFMEPFSQSKNARNLIHGFYVNESLAETPSLPFYGSDCLEIPVCLPDDEILVDRLGIHDETLLIEIWTQLLDFTYRSGELFNLLIHAERIDQIATPLDALLADSARRKGVWMASLGDIAQWWKQRSTFSFKVDPSGEDCYEVTANATKEASVLLEHPDGRTEYIEPESGGHFRVSSSFRPTVFVTPDAPNKAVRWLSNEGYALEREGNPDRCAFVLNDSCPETVRDLLAELCRGKGPALRFGRWPHRYRSALSVSLDLDAFTMLDFLRRANHFRKATVQNGGPA